MEAADRRPLGVAAFFGLLCDHFSSGRLAELADLWSFPTAIEVEGELVVMQTPEALRLLLEKRRTALIQAGLTGLTPRLSAIEMPRNGRFRVWIRWVHHYGTHAEEDPRGMVYFLATRPDGHLTIEMVDFVNLPAEQELAQSA